MIMAREFDAAMLRLYRQGKAFGGVYSQLGNEATSVGSAYALDTSRDVLFPMHRNIGSHFVFGQDIDTLMVNHLARQGSQMRGTDGTGHYADPQRRIYGNVSHLGAMIPVAAGFTLASRMRGESCVALTYIGDGGAQVGEVHEALNFASVQKLPLILIIENNQYAYSTPSTLEYACAVFPIGPSVMECSVKRSMEPTSKSSLRRSQRRSTVPVAAKDRLSSRP